ncbi:MAG: AI-2E family transporter [Niabella sp.]
MQQIFNERVKQVLMLSIILGLLFLTIKELTAFLPGLLGAVTLYIVSRGRYLNFVYNKKWRKSWTAIAFMLFYVLIIGIPLAAAVTLISPKITALVSNPDAIIETSRQTIIGIQQKTGIKIISENTISGIINKLSVTIPKLLNSTINVVANIAMMLFILYYMLVNAKEMEKYIKRILPLKKSNVDLLFTETKKMVIANTLGIPLISLIQGIVATIGYIIFGVKDWGLYGFLTGVFAFFPVVGTMVVWIPVVLYMYATGDTMNALLLALYSGLITGNVDYLARVTLLKRMGDVHPVMTILGVLVGLGLFGFVGLVIGPLLINYILVLNEIYMNEFVGKVPEVSVSTGLHQEDISPPLSDEEKNKEQDTTLQ